MYIDFLKKVFLVYREMELSYIFPKKKKHDSEKISKILGNGSFQTQA